MAGIDNNTLLYLRGDSFTDLSSNNVLVTNQNCILENNSIKFSDNSKLILNGIFDAEYIGDFTVEFFIKLTTFYYFRNKKASLSEESKKDCPPKSPQLRQFRRPI